MLKQILLTTAITTLSSTAIAGTHCTYHPENERIPAITFQEQLQQKGYKIHKFELDDNCYEIEGLNAQGERIDEKFDTKTGELVRSKHKH